MNEIDRMLRAALKSRDQSAIAEAYLAAAEAQFDINENEPAWFLLTHAYIHALEAGLPIAAMLEARLKAENRA
ncbi:MAG: hypothetical protein AAFR13_09795 [Pseudomonadota bacterium]